MYEKVLIANRGDQPPASGAAAQPNRAAAGGGLGGLAPEVCHV